MMVVMVTNVSLLSRLPETSARSGKNVHKVLEKVLQEITYYHTKALRGIMYKMKGAYTMPSIRIKGCPPSPCPSSPSGLWR
jgi:hypothetical protein